MMTTRWIVGLAMTFAVLPIAARRGLWLYKLAMTGQPDPDRLKNVERPKLGAALKRQVIEVFLQKKLLKWSIPGVAHAFVFWAFLILGTVYVEAYGALFDEDFAHPAGRALGGPRLRPGHHRAARAVRPRDLRDHPVEGLTGPQGPRVPLQGLPHRRRLADPVHDRQRPLDDVLLPRRRLRRREPALRQRRLRLQGRRAGLREHPQRAHAGVGRDRRPVGPHRRHARLPDHRRLLQAHAHLHRAAEHHLRAQARRPRPAAADAVRRQDPGLRGGRPRGRHLRPVQDRGLHLEGLPRLRHLHRVRALPVAVPGLEHRQAALAEDGHPRAARPRVRQGAVAAGDRGGARAPAAVGQGRGRAPAGRHRGGERGHRPRRAVVLHQLRRLRRAVPGRHRAHRPHRRHAPLPDDDRVELSRPRPAGC